MNILEDEGFCTCCGNFATYSYGDENYSLITKDLSNYNKYKDIYVYRCPNCGFISTDITGIEGVLYGEVLNSLEFKNTLKYKYLEGLDKELYNNHSSEIPANIYEAYSFVCIEAKDYEKLVRVINKTIELKTIMANRYRKSQDELGGEEDNDDLYDKLDKLIKDSIEINSKQIDFYFSQLDRSNIFLKLIYIENLARLGKKEEAKKLFQKITNKYLLKDDLKIYIADSIK